MKPKFNLALFFILIIMLKCNISYSQDIDNSALGLVKSVYSFFNKISFKAFIEEYYAYDFYTNNIKNGNNRILSSTCSFNNEFRLDLIHLSVKYNDENFRAALAIQYGDIPFLLKSPEKEYLGMINQGYFGIKLMDKVWVDFGYMSNPIGLESIKANKNFLSSVSVAGYFAPDNILGIKVNWEISDKLNTSVQLYNTYGIITTPNLNKYLGFSIDYSPNERVNMGYNGAFTNFGLEGESPYLQFYNNIFLILQLFKKIDLQAELDFASQTNSKLSDSNATAYLSSGFLGIRYHILPELSISGRGEFYYDPDGIESKGVVGNNDYLKTWGFSIGLQYSPFKNFFIRGEYQILYSDQKIFYNFRDYRNSIIFSTALEL